VRNMKVFNAVAAVVALGGLSSVASAAVTIANVNTAEYGLEYTTAQAANTTLDLYTAAAGVNPVDSPYWSSNVAYLSGDIVTVTLSGAARFSTATSDTATLTCDADGGAYDATAVTAVTSATNSTTYTFTLTAACNTTAGGARMYLVGADLTNASMSAVGNIGLSVGVTRSGASIDTTATPVTVASVVQEFNVAVAGAFDGTISHVANSRTFTAGATDVATFAITNRDLVGATDTAATAGLALKVTLSGNWLVVDDDGNGVCVDGDLTAGDGRITVTSPAAAPTVTINSTCSTVTIDVTDAASLLTAAGAGGNLVVTVDNNGDADGTVGESLGHLVPGTITGTATLFYTPDNAAAATSRSPIIAPGAFASGASTVFVPYMPAGVGFSQVLYLTNNSLAPGTVTVTGYDQNGVSCDSTQMGGPITVGANRVVNLSGAIASGLAQCWGGANTTNKLTLTIQTNLPDEKIEVYSAFNAAGDRATVFNSSNGRSPALNGQGSGNSTSRD
jgi:hypothetical protein